MFSQQARDDFFYSKYPLLKIRMDLHKNLLLRYKISSKAVLNQFESSSKEVPMRILLDSIRLILTLICLLLNFYASFPDFYGFSLTSIRLFLTFLCVFSHFYGYFPHFYSSFSSLFYASFPHFYGILSLLCVFYHFLWVCSQFYGSFTNFYGSFPNFYGSFPHFYGYALTSMGILSLLCVFS
jgi:hypothetical protein